MNMSKRIVIDPVTRIEGHAKISIFLDDAGNVSDAEFHVVEFRGFEKFCEGRPYSEMPGITPGVADISPVSVTVCPLTGTNIQRYVIAPPVGSDDCVSSNWNAAVVLSVPFGPAIAIGNTVNGVGTSILA